MTGSNEALADAFSGVVGTLVSLWCFYPIERIKINLQAGKSLSSSPSSASLRSAAIQNENEKDVLRRQIQILRDLIQQYFRGCWTKTMHATSSSFCYFYFYSWILSLYNQKRERRLQRGSSSSSSSNTARIKLAPLRPSTRLVLSAIAAMMNTFVTLPLDVLSSKRTVESEDEDEDKDDEFHNNVAVDSNTAHESSTATMEKAWNSIDKNGAKSSPGLTATASTESSSSSSSTIEMVFHEASSRSEELFSLDDGNDENDNDNDNNTSIYSNGSNNSILSVNEEYRLRWKEQLEQRKARRLSRKRQLPPTIPRDGTLPKDSTQTIAAANRTSASASATTANNLPAFIRRWSKLWKGLAPALLLCSNPSIHYTVFDMLKTKTLAWKRLRNPRGNGNQHHTHQLSVSEAFVLGLLSKFVATIVTYPLIRAKVLMMVRGDGDDTSTPTPTPTPTPCTDTTNQRSNNMTNSSSSSSHQASAVSKSKPPSSSISTIVSSPTLWSVLKESYYRDGGIPGLYKGCDWQLIHTLLKSALMMAIREHITDTSRALFGVA